MTKSVLCVLCALAVLCMATPMPQSKLPNTVGLTADAKNMAIQSQQELADMKGDVVAREALYASRRFKLQAALNATQYKAQLRKQLEEICDAHVRLLEITQAGAVKAVEANNQASNVRSQQHTAHEDDATAQHTGDTRRIGDLLNIKLRVSNELEAQEFTRGNGIAFDKFVREHQKAIDSLHSITDLASQLQILIEAKQQHLAESVSKIEKVLSCPECSTTTGALNQAVTKHSQQTLVWGNACKQMSQEPNLAQLQANAVELQNQLLQLAEDEALQRKAETQRKEKTEQQLQSVKSLIFASATAPSSSA
eukprot:c9727_g1_i1.p1 GENE.c9727_g1_i1~~c9727_g1_i1.p1  ORF type:complete len:329 (+),score=98.02 c9727_g1_i1:61-987(+)